MFIRMSWTLSRISALVHKEAARWPNRFASSAYH